MLVSCRLRIIKVGFVAACCLSLCFTMKWLQTVCGLCLSPIWDILCYCDRNPWHFFHMACFFCQDWQGKRDDADSGKPKVLWYFFSFFPTWLQRDISRRIHKFQSTCPTPWKHFNSCRLIAFNDLQWSWSDSQGANTDALMPSVLEAGSDGSRNQFVWLVV